MMGTKRRRSDHGSRRSRQATQLGVVPVGDQSRQRVGLAFCEVPFSDLGLRLVFKERVTE